MNEEKQKLALAEQKAKELFAAVEVWGLIVPGKPERELAAACKAIESVGDC